MMTPRFNVDRYLDSALGLEEGLVRVEEPRISDRLVDLALACRAHIPRALFFLALPLVVTLLAACFLLEELARGYHALGIRLVELDWRGIDRTLFSAAKCAVVGIALYLVFVVLLALNNGAFDGLVR